VNTLVRVALLAYPRQFRLHYGHEWARTVNDLRVHRGRSTAQVAATVIAEAATVALRMRWENLMPVARTTLTVITAVIALAAFAVGSPAIAVLVVALVALGALQFAGRDQPIAPTDPSITRRWWIWLAGGAAAFLIGLAVVAIDGDDNLSTAAWATWLISWAAAILLAAIGVGLAATRIVATRR
jgi:hypothetical protein